MNPEQKFYYLIKDHLPGHVNRIENSTGVGMPDVNFCFKGQETWLELKANIGLLTEVNELIQIPFSSKRLRDSQIIWHGKRVLQGGRVLVAVRDGGTITILQCKGMHQYKTLYVGKKPWNWEAITSILEGEPRA